MILTCPSCLTRYQVDAAKFPPAGRKVRCAKCGQVWHEAGPQPEPPEETGMSFGAPIPAAPEPEAALERGPDVVSSLRAQMGEPAAAEPRSYLIPILGWACLIAALAGIGLAAAWYREEITAVWPQSAGLYSSLGMKVNIHGIDFERIGYHRESQDGLMVLIVSGRIVNKGTRELPVPQSVRVTLSDASNHELYHWNFTPEAQSLSPGQSVPFLTRLSSPPSAARHLEVRFAGNGP